MKEYVITKKEGGCIISGILEGLGTERRRWNPKSSNSFPFIFDFLSLGLCNILIQYPECSWIGEEPLDSYPHLHCLWNHECGSIESKKTGTSGVSWEEYRIYPELNLERRRRCNLGRLQRGQQAGKAWLGTHLNCITPIRFSVGGADKGATECGGSMNNQLTVFSRGAFVTVCKG